jgi:hypothetical protein
VGGEALVAQPDDQRLPDLGLDHPWPEGVVDHVDLDRLLESDEAVRKAAYGTGKPSGAPRETTAQPPDDGADELPAAPG